MHVIGALRTPYSSLGAAAHLALEDDPWSGVNFSDFSTTQSNYVPETYNGNYNYDTPYSSGGSDFSISDTYYGGYAPSSGLSDYNDSSWNSAPTYANYNDQSWEWEGQSYAPSYYYDSSEDGAFSNYYGTSDPSMGLYTNNFNDSDWNSAWNWNSPEIYTPTSAYNSESDGGGWDYWYGSNEYGNNTFSTSESYYNYQDELTRGFGDLGFYGGESAGVQGVYVDNSFDYNTLYNDPTGTAYYNVPGTDYYGTGWGTPTQTNYATNPFTYYYGSADTNEYLNRCYGMTADGRPTQNADLLYCGQGPSPTELYATYGDEYLGYTRYATGGEERCSLKDGNCAVEEIVSPSVRRTQSGAIIDSSVSSFYGGVDAYGYSMPQVQYYNTPTTTYRAVQQTTTAPRVQYIQAPVVQQSTPRVQYVPTAIPTPTPIPIPVPVLSAPTQLSCDIRITHNGNFISVYYLTSSHTVNAYINNIGAVEPAVGTAKIKNVYPPFANAYIMTVYGAQGQAANCSAATPTYTPAPVQYTSTGQSYTYQSPQVQVTATQNPQTVDYVSVSSLPYTGLESTAYFFIVLFAAAASIGALFMYREVFVTEASDALVGMLGMKKFRTLGRKIESAAAKHESSLGHIPRDK